MTPRERLFALEQFGIKLGLDNIATLVGALNRPDRGYPVVHVTGTNGKGSVTAMVERGLRAAGCRTGRYTSPHLARIEERIALDGVPIDDTAFDALAADVMHLVDRLRADGRLPHEPTFFEATTAMAFEAFRRAGVDVAVVEVGLGGRFDATNVVAPALTAITSVAYDHERHLGSSLAQIAYEKAGIIKAGVPVVTGPLPADARAVVADVARATGAPIIEAEVPHGGDPIVLALPGRHQHANAAVAVTMLRALAPRFSVRREHIVAALTEVQWPARLEWLRVPAAGDLLLDAAHNPAGAAALAAYVGTSVGPLPLVMGVMRDKDVRGMLRALLPVVSRVVATEAATPRALDAGTLAAEVTTVSPSTPVDLAGDPGEAVVRACREGGRAMAAGSILLVGPLRAELIAQGAVPVRYPSTSDPFLLG